MTGKTAIGTINRRSNGAQARIAIAAFVSAQILLFSEFAAFAAFQQGSPDIEAEAMGGAFVAKADNSAAVFINPAGFARIKTPEISFAYGQILAGLMDSPLSHQSASLVVPLSSISALAAGINIFNGAGVLKEYEGVLGGSLKLSQSLRIGTNISCLRHSYKASGGSPASFDPVFSGGMSKSAIGVDAGLLFEPDKKISLGLSARHINQPDLGLFSEDRVPMELRTGAMFKLKQFSLLADINRRGKTTSWGIGGECSLSGSLPGFLFRAGLNADQLTGGFGLSLGAVSVDYAFVLMKNLLHDNYGNHKLALTRRFGASGERQ